MIGMVGIKSIENGQDFPWATPSGHPSEQPCQPSENPVLPSSFIQINPILQYQADTLMSLTALHCVVISQEYQFKRRGLWQRAAAVIVGIFVMRP